MILLIKNNKVLFDGSAITDGSYHEHPLSHYKKDGRLTVPIFNSTWSRLDNIPDLTFLEESSFTHYIFSFIGNDYMERFYEVVQAAAEKESKESRLIITKDQQLVHCNHDLTTWSLNSLMSFGLSVGQLMHYYDFYCKGTKGLLYCVDLLTITPGKFDFANPLGTHGLLAIQKGDPYRYKKLDVYFDDTPKHCPDAPSWHYGMKQVTFQEMVAAGFGAIAKIADKMASNIPVKTAPAKVAVKKPRSRNTRKQT